MSVQLHCGDCLEVMRTLADASVDAIVTDPPYHLKSGKSSAGGFMGKQWDGGDIAFRPETWAEMLPVAKAGALLFAFGGTRTFHRIACAIEDAGWQIEDTVIWLHGQGFPKHKSKLKPAFEPITVARKPGLKWLGVDACRIGTGEDKGVWPITDRHSKRNLEFGMKPTATTPAGRWPANVVLSHLPECRETGTKRVKGAARTGPNGGCKPQGYSGGFNGLSANYVQDRNYTDPDGLETVAAWECAEGCPVAMLDAQSGERGASNKASGPSLTGLSLSRCRGQFNGTNESPAFYGDSGGASRFYYCAKASRRDRNEGLEGMPARAGTIGAEGHKINPTTGRAVVDPPRQNHHPTVKSIDLMRWLCRLACPPGGMILDPFMGSGSTGKAARLEGFGFVGIERDPEYFAIAERRIRAAQNTTPFLTAT